MVLDIDPQSSLSEILVANGGFGLLKEWKKRRRLIIYLICLFLRLKSIHVIQYLSILKNWIDTIRERYDIILIDCPPVNNLIIRSAFLMSDYYIIPTVLDGPSTNGVIHYINTIEKTYEKYCGDTNDGIIAKYFFGEKPQLIGIFMP